MKGVLISAQQGSLYSRNFLWVDFYLFRNVKSTDTLEKDETSKQIQANQIWERKLEAEKNNNFVLAAKHEKEFRVSHFIQSVVPLIVI